MRIVTSWNLIASLPWVMVYAAAKVALYFPSWRMYILGKNIFAVIATASQSKH
jgi:hypothetical protein